MFNLDSILKFFGIRAVDPIEEDDSDETAPMGDFNTIEEEVCCLKEQLLELSKTVHSQPKFDMEAIREEIGKVLSAIRGYSLEDKQDTTWSELAKAHNEFLAEVIAPALREIKKQYQELKSSQEEMMRSSTEANSKILSELKSLANEMGACKEAVEKSKRRVVMPFWHDWNTVDGFAAGSDDERLAAWALKKAVFRSRSDLEGFRQAVADSPDAVERLWQAIEGVRNSNQLAHLREIYFHDNKEHSNPSERPSSDEQR